ncbi:hypothetical protein CC1G_07113 [Coprinopsis cinerea okayama7|uniref:Uncharacterized protein n=1 Tax=Coprinopsis cinerea (strain Okayama-7 / 130 / ATCC MYA-4618 / FGSC 9003) TaxID=240176 RepID=A8NUI4_COPC7|nr:hypothetical protein CC1G_07113 [Coprinopsis cinerea okayama7\|eukprot:XP_001836466.2 hypothetical protein CC1G_07113 [Coprinopsis cinerea okayama7\
MAGHGPHASTPWTTNAIKQLKLVIPGGVITWYIGVWEEFWRTVSGYNGSLARTGALTAGGLGLATIALFIYILFIPITTGEEPDYRAWRQSPVLSSVIPTLTTTIVLGWLVALIVFGQWSSLGYIKGFIGVSAAYALTFGLLGLLPAPKAKPKTRQA